MPSTFQRYLAPGIEKMRDKALGFAEVQYQPNKGRAAGPQFLEFGYGSRLAFEDHRCLFDESGREW